MVKANVRARECLRNDRRSSYEQWGLGLDDALANETRLGLATLHSGETLEGAGRFVAGAGRSGAAVPPTREPGQPGLGPVETGDGQR